MFFHDVNEEDFIELLGALPHPPAMTRAHLLGAFDVLVAGDDPRGWWNKLVMDRGEEGAAKAVAQVIISKGGERLLSLMRAEAPVAMSSPGRMTRDWRGCCSIPRWRGSLSTSGS